MAISELSPGYQKAASLLRKRLKELRTAEKNSPDPEVKRKLKRRIAELTPILTQMNELAELTENYYKPGYYRNKKYSSNCFHDLKINFEDKENR